MHAFNISVFSATIAVWLSQSAGLSTALFLPTLDTQFFSNTDLWLNGFSITALILFWNRFLVTYYVYFTKTDENPKQILDLSFNIRVFPFHFSTVTVFLKQHLVDLGGTAAEHTGADCKD